MKMNLSTLYCFIPSLLATNGKTKVIKRTGKVQMEKTLAEPIKMKRKSFKRKFL